MDMENKLTAVDSATAGLVARPKAEDSLKIEGMFHVECVGADGKVKWTEEFENVVTTQGKNSILDRYLGLAAAPTNQSVGLHTTVGNAASTYATPSPQVECVAGTYSARLSPAFAAASAGAKSTSAAVSFPILGTDTVAGCFLNQGPAAVATRGDTAAAAAVLFSSGAFGGGSRAVINGDTLNVTYTLTLT
jgi:hypothetical protein